MPKDYSLIPRFCNTRKLWIIYVPKNTRSEVNNRPLWSVRRFKNKDEAWEHSKKLREAKRLGHYELSQVDPRESIKQMRFYNKVLKMGYSERVALEVLHKNKSAYSSATKFKELLDKYKSTCSDHVRAGECSTWNWVERQLIPLYQIRIRDLDAEFMSGWIDEWYKHYPAESDATKVRAHNRLLSRLKNVFKLQSLLGVNMDDPLLLIKSRKQKRGAVKDNISVISPVELRGFLSDCVDHYPELIPYFTSCFFAGLRPKSEAAEMSFEKFYWDINKLEVYATKTNRKREIDIEPCLKAWIEPYIGKRDLVFMPVTYPAAIKIKRRIVQGKFRGGEPIMEWSRDITRHSYASYFEASFRMREGNMERLRVNMGHKDYNMIDNHYRSFIRESNAADYWIEPTPAQIKKIEAYLETV